MEPQTTQSRMPAFLATLSLFGRLKANPRSTTRQVIEARMVLVDQAAEMRERIIRHAIQECRADIVVFREPQGWMARFATEPQHSRTVALFGTDTLPTPFTARAKPDMVLAELRRRNPGLAVTLRG